MSRNNEQRHFHRIFYNSQVTLSHESTQWPCELIDISLHGCLLRFNKAWEQSNLETLYTLTLVLSEAVSITMSVSVSHVIDKEVGFKCEHIDLDSISTLRRLVELNLGDNKLLERDLIALAQAN
ncbi:MAG: PilZ domain-containing protein [Methylococcaceae bacterium]|nr:PilZ domain-containing protein [Methylococcaceae bacterium]